MESHEDIHADLRCFVQFEMALTCLFLRTKGDIITVTPGKLAGVFQDEKDNEKNLLCYKYFKEPGVK